jgi:hypothetical protein
VGGGWCVYAGYGLAGDAWMYERAVPRPRSKGTLQTLVTAWHRNFPDARN